MVGAGPTGLTLAGELLHHGVPTRLVERDAEPHQESRATGVHARTLQILERLGIVDWWLEAALSPHVFRLRGPDGEQLYEERLAEVDCSFPYTLNVQQRITNRLLERHLERQEGRVERDVELLSPARATSSPRGGSGACAPARGS